MLPEVVTRNMKVLLGIAAIIVGGVEMRLKVQDISNDHMVLAQALRTHENGPPHEATSKVATNQAVQEERLKGIDERLRKVEQGQEKTYEAVEKVLGEVRAMRNDH